MYDEIVPFFPDGCKVFPQEAILAFLGVGPRSTEDGQKAGHIFFVRLVDPELGYLTPIGGITEVAGVDIADLITRLDERFQTASRELGGSQEARVRGLLRRFAGQEVEGRLLGLAEEVVRLPHVAGVDAYRSPDGRVELDAVARTATGGTWVAEVKWRGRQAGRRELERLQANAEATQLPAPVTLWYISRSGFSQEARDYAREQGILLTDRASLEALAQALSR